MQIEINSKRFVVDSTREKDFWYRVKSGNWEPHTFKILDIFLDSNHSYLDIGSWIGPTVLYGCQLAKHAYALEPDPVAYFNLEKNVNLNPELLSKITLSNHCLSDFCGMTKIGNKTSHDGGDSMSSVLFADAPQSWMVQAITLSQFVKRQGINDCNFIKMDIEGGETIVLPNIADYLSANKPTLYLSMHPRFLPQPRSDFEKIVKVLELYDHIYTNKWIEVDESFILNDENLKGIYELVVTDNKVTLNGTISQ